jgi:hypothetical protein
MAGLARVRPNLLQKWSLCDGCGQAAHSVTRPEWLVLAHDDTIPGAIQAGKVLENLLNWRLCSIPGHGYQKRHIVCWP